VAAVTGGALGIGRATAFTFAEEGAAVAVGDVETAAAEAVAREIAERGSRAIAVGVDVGEAAQVQAFVDKTVAEFGRLDVLVGRTPASPTPRRFSIIPSRNGIACCAST